MNNIVVISGPSGSGKSTLIRKLMEKHPELTFSISHTSRDPRKGERNGREYHFVSPETFKEMVSGDAFVEWARVYQNYYGTSFKEIEAKFNEGKFLVLDIDVQGARNIKKKYPEALFIMVTPPSLAELKRRLVGREKAVDANTRKRLEIAREELSRYAFYDYVVVNDDLDEAFRVLDAVYTAFLNTAGRRGKYIEKLLSPGGQR